jgi:hypothetical protein
VGFSKDQAARRSRRDRVKCDVAQLVHYCLDCSVCLESSQVQADTGMGALDKGDVLLEIGATQNEDISSFENGRVAIVGEQ